MERGISICCCYCRLRGENFCETTRNTPSLVKRSIAMVFHFFSQIDFAFQGHPKLQGGQRSRQVVVCPSPTWRSVAAPAWGPGDSDMGRGSCGTCSVPVVPAEQRGREGCVTPQTHSGLQAGSCSSRILQEVARIRQGQSWKGSTGTRPAPPVQQDLVLQEILSPPTGRY